MEYGCEVWHNGDVSQIKKLESIQYETLNRVTGIYHGTASHVLAKEAAVPPLGIKLEHVLELILTRILLRLDHGNSGFERLKKNGENGESLQKRKILRN